jgi:hypothetical protein
MRGNLVPAALAALLLTPAAAEATPTKVCKSADMRYPFEPGGPKTFGVFRLTITGAGCKIARPVARRWMDRFEGNLQDGRVKLPKRVRGFRFKQLPPNEAQTYRLRGRREGASIRFDYVVPNG